MSVGEPVFGFFPFSKPAFLSFFPAAVCSAATASPCRLLALLVTTISFIDQIPIQRQAPRSPPAAHQQISILSLNHSINISQPLFFLKYNTIQTPPTLATTLLIVYPSRHLQASDERHVQQSAGVAGHPRGQRLVHGGVPLEGKGVRRVAVERLALRDVGRVHAVDAQLHVLAVPGAVRQLLAVGGPGAGPDGAVVLPVQLVDGGVQALYREGLLQEERAVLEGVPLPDPQVVRPRARGRVLARAGPGRGLVGPLVVVVVVVKVVCGLRHGVSQ